MRHPISLAQTGSFSKSALALFLTQPALSRSIRALENEPGQPLFDRIGRHSEVTPFGRDVVERARQLMLAADDLRESGQQLARGMAGSLRIGLGSGPGAMLMTPLLMPMATPRSRLRPTCAPPKRTRCARGSFLCRRGHPLAPKRSGVSFEPLRAYPIASTPLSDEVARVLLELIRRTDSVLIAIRATRPDLVELDMTPALNATARFAIVTLTGRSEAPALPIVRRLMHDLLQDA